ncbi:MAG: LytTR family DNA-binding domain-containing protein [Clostridia bacterium]|nr:LytTR family DNA-binding domain-containing protein [Clostridia bacterium]
MSGKIEIAICDDEKIYIDEISERIRRAAGECEVRAVIHTCDSGEDLIKLCEEKAVDAAFLDIAMPGTDGFKTAERLSEIKSDILLVFVSSREAMVFSSYEYKPFWFVPKSQIEMLDTVIKKLIKTVQKSQNLIRSIPLRLEDKETIELDLENVMYIKSEGHYLNMFFKDGTKSGSLRGAMYDIERQLEEYGFVRCHKQFLVNCRAISLIENAHCVLIDKTKLPISRASMKKTKEIFQKYLRSI